MEKPVGTEQVHHSLGPALAAGLSLLLLLDLLWAWLNRPVPLRLSLGDKGLPRDYRLRPGAKVGLGGSPLTASPGDDVFPLAGLPAPAAFLQAEPGWGSLLGPRASPGRPQSPPQRPDPGNTPSPCAPATRSAWSSPPPTLRPPASIGFMWQN